MAYMTDDHPTHDAGVLQELCAAIDQQRTGILVVPLATQSIRMVDTTDTDAAAVRPAVWPWLWLLALTVLVVVALFFAGMWYWSSFS